MGTDEDAIRDVLTSYAAHCNAGDFESWIALWDREGRQMPPDAPCRVGIGAIREAMEPPFKTMDLKLTLTSIDEATVLGDFGLTRCNYSLKATPKGGGDVIGIMPDGKALTLYRQQPDGSWKIAYDSFNSNTPANTP